MLQLDTTAPPARCDKCGVIPRPAHEVPTCDTCQRPEPPCGCAPRHSRTMNSARVGAVQFSCRYCATSPADW